MIELLRVLWFMFRLVLFCFFIPLIADVEVDISANKITRKNNVITLEGNTTAKLLGYSLGSKKATVDTKNNVFNLQDDVFLEKENIFINSNNVSVYMKDENINLEGFRLQDTKSKLWVESDNANACKGIYTIKESTLSSCDNDNVSWKITFSDGEYNEKENNFYLENAVVRIYDVPILYTPYLSISNKVRKSGFLAPEHTISSSELGYMQPYYVNINNASDLELTANIRTKKGLGVNSTYRLASSKNTKTNMNLIYFNYDKNYADEFHISKKDIYGLELEHSINIQDEGYNKQKLFIDLKKSNSANYESFKNLDTSQASILKKTTSKVGYVNTHKSWYFDIFVKQYEDINTSELSRKLPQVNIHKNLENLFFNDLYYFVDLKSQNLYRKDKVSLFTNKASLQFIYDKYLIDNYLNISFYNNVSYSFDNFYINESSIDNEYTKVYHKFKISTDLMGKYKSLSHNIKADVNYLVLDYQEGLPFAYSIYDSEIKLIQKQDFNSKLEVNIKNSFYNAHNKVFHHKVTGSVASISQSRLVDDIQEKKILNNVSFGIGNNINFENKINYSFHDNKVDKVLSSLEYKQQNSLKINHIYDTTEKYKSDYLRLNSKKKISKEYSLLLNVDFDNKIKTINRWGVGLEKDEDCFAYKIKLSKNNSLANSSDETIFYFKVHLKPLGGFENKYENI